MIVIKDFWAPWCGPCKMIAPILEEISKEFSEVQIEKINVDDNPDLAMQNNIRSVPTLLILKNGEIKDRIVGTASKDFIKQKIDNLLDK